MLLQMKYLKQQHGYKNSIPPWFAFSASSTFCIFLLFYFNSSLIFSSLTSFLMANLGTDPSMNQQNHIVFASKAKDRSECEGKYIYIHNLPSRFNADLIKNCHSLSQWSDMCKALTNSGFGPQSSSLSEHNGSASWFSTNQFSLEVIFHTRMKQYECLTNDSAKASAIYVPFYAGLEVARFLWTTNVTQRDALGLDLVKWVRAQPEWGPMWGKDHFLVVGRIAMDFMRIAQKNKPDDSWGSKLLRQPELENMTVLLIESSGSGFNEFSIPYPTSFHPSTHSQMTRWQTRVKTHKRPYLFSFAGAPRPQSNDSIRNQIINQCLNFSDNSPQGKCKLLRCDQSLTENCDDPATTMKLFTSSVFCLQPPGDSYTRRSAFDSIIAGCIPVFFHPASAYLQYPWHLPRDYTKYSVFISNEDVRSGKVNIHSKLSAIPREEVQEMRKEVIGLIPGIVYADPMAKKSDRGFEDAFDIAVAQILNRIGVLRKEEFSRNQDKYSFP